MRLALFRVWDLWLGFWFLIRRGNRWPACFHLSVVESVCVWCCLTWSCRIWWFCSWDIYVDVLFLSVFACVFFFYFSVILLWLRIVVFFHFSFIWDASLFSRVELGFDFVVSVFCLVLEFRLHLDVSSIDFRTGRRVFLICSYQSMLDFFPFWGISDLKFVTGKVWLLWPP